MGRSFYTRREFLKKSACGGAMFVSAPWWAKGFWDFIPGAEVEKRAVSFVDHFAIPSEDISRVVKAALANGGDYADVYFDYRLFNSLVLEEHRVKTASQGVSLGAGVRVVSGEKTGYAYTEEITLDKLIEAAKIAALIARSGGKLEKVALIEEKVPSRYRILLPPAEAEVDDRLSFLSEADKAASSYDPRIKRVMVLYQDELRFIQIATSEGRLVKDTQPMLRLMVQTIAEDKGERRVGFGGEGGRYGLELLKVHPPKDIARKAAEQAVKMLDAKEAPAGEQMIVLSAGEPAVLIHEAVGHGLEADFNRKKTSAFAGKIGEKVASDSVDIRDSGAFENLRGSINTDDEGTVPGDTVLIEKGVLKGYMYDKLSARLMRAKPTGNGRRQNYTFFPIPRMTNTYMVPGRHSPEEIIASVKKGVYAKMFAGGQVDITNGKFVFMAVESYLVEDGKITAPLKDVTLIGDGPTVLTRIDMVGNDFAWDAGIGTCGKDGQGVPAGMGMPSVRISHLLVGGTKRGA
jgi:TldD protein